MFLNLSHRWDSSVHNIKFVFLLWICLILIWLLDWPKKPLCGGGKIIPPQQGTTRTQMKSQTEVHNTTYAGRAAELPRPLEGATLPTSPRVHQPEALQTLPFGFLWRLHYRRWLIDSHWPLAMDLTSPLTTSLQVRGRDWKFQPSNHLVGSSQPVPNLVTKGFSKSHLINKTKGIFIALVFLIINHNNKAIINNIWHSTRSYLNKPGVKNIFIKTRKIKHGIRIKLC